MNSSTNSTTIFRWDCDQTVDTGKFNSHHATEFILIFILFYFTFVDKADFVDTLYTWSAFNTEEIGKEIGESLAYLTKTYPIEKIHLIGECDTLKNSRYKSLPSKK